MSLQPLPQFDNEYDGSKQRYLVQILETSFRDLTKLIALSNDIPLVQTNGSTQGNVDSSETTLYSFNLNTSTINSTTWEIYITTFGTFASTSNNKELKLYLNNSLIYDSGNVAANGGTWRLDTTIVWVGNNVQKIITTSTSSNATFTNICVYTAGSVVFSNIVNVSLTGTGVATNDIIAEAMVVTMQGN